MTGHPAPPQDDRAWTRARELVLAAYDCDGRRFGELYAETIASEWLLPVDRCLLLLLATLAARRLPDSFDDAAAVDLIRDLTRAVRPRARAIMGVNAVVLEHVLRSVFGLSGYLTSIDRTFTCLYAGLLSGALLESADELAAIARESDVGPCASQTEDTP